jgi:hypothetical protein
MEYGVWSMGYGVWSMEYGALPSNGTGLLKNCYKLIDFDNTVIETPKASATSL